MSTASVLPRIPASLSLPLSHFRGSCLSRRPLQFTHAHSLHLLASPVSHFTMASRRSARISALAGAKPVEPALGPASTSRKRKASPSVAVEDDEKAGEMAPPSTPKRRPKKSTARLAPPSTPAATPSAVRLIAEPAAAPDGAQTPTSSAATITTTTTTTPKPKSRAVARLADPNSTNAPLLSPETSRVISRSLGADIPSENPTTTVNILQDACAHLIKGK